MNTQENSLPDIDQALQEMIDSGEIQISYGVITDGLCDTPEHQAQFDAQQKGKPPLAE